MTKLIFLVVLVIVVVLWFKHRMQAGRRDSAADAAQKPVEDMVRCQTCGVNLPRSEAILSQGSFYCCDEHRRGG